MAAQATDPAGAADPAQGHAAGGRPDIDWEAIEGSPEFEELVSRRRAFVVPATIFFLAWYFGFIVLAGYAPDFMGREFIWDGLTVGYVLALTQFLMTWVLGWMYMRRADRVFDPLAARVVEQAEGRASAPAQPEPPAPARVRAPTGEVAPQ